MKQVREDREWIVKSEAETSPSSGCAPHERKIEDHLRNGIIILDKPAGPTSHDVASWVRDIVHAKKAGQSGTLDPNVTGVLPTMVDNATKIAPALISREKEYVAIMRLHKEVSEERIRETAAKLVGTISQTPPKKSAVKRVERKRQLYGLDVLEVSGREVLFRARTEAGTYIRNLCIDFGREMGVPSHMQELRRVMAGPFTEDQCVRLHDLKDAYEFFKEDGKENLLREVVKPVEFGVKHLGAVTIKDSAVSAVCNGAPLAVGGVCGIKSGIIAGDLIAIMSLKGELVALGRAASSSEEMFHKRAGIAASVDRVVMDKGVYPKWKKAEGKTGR